MPFSWVYTFVHIILKTADVEVRQSSPCNRPWGPRGAGGGRAEVEPYPVFNAQLYFINDNTIIY